MKLNVNKKIGRNEYVFQVEGDNLHAVLMETKKLSFNDVPKCGLCDSDLLYLTAYTTKEQGFEYVKVVCAKCSGSVTFGKSKDKKDVYFLRKTDDYKLDWQEDTRTEKKAPVRKPNLPEGFGLKEVDVDTDAPF